MRTSLGKAPRASLSEAQLRSQLHRAASIGQDDAGDGRKGARRCTGSVAAIGQSAKRSLPARPQGTWGRPSSAPSQQNGTNGPQDFLRRSTQVRLTGLALPSCRLQSRYIVAHDFRRHSTQMISMQTWRALSLCMSGRGWGKHKLRPRRVHRRC